MMQTTSPSWVIGRAPFNFLELAFTALRQASPKCVIPFELHKSTRGSTEHVSTRDTMGHMRRVIIQHTEYTKREGRVLFLRQTSSPFRNDCRPI